MNWATLSQKGSREINEDSIGVYSCGDQELFIVADGLGGHGKGDIASRLAVAAFESTVESTKGMPLIEQMKFGFKRAQSDILNEQKKSGNIHQMKTTVCALLTQGQELAWGHIGDSRLYAFSHNRIKTRTLDHSVPQMLVMTREIKESDIRNHPDRNKLLRVLGISGVEPKYELSDIFPVRKYQAFLLCSDGFWELVLEKEMCAYLKHSNNAQEWLSKMQKTVEQRGSVTDMDNYSAIAIMV